MVFLPGKDVRVVRPREGLLELFQLVAGEGSPVASLLPLGEVVRHFLRAVRPHQHGSPPGRRRVVLLLSLMRLVGRLVLTQMMMMMIPDRVCHGRRRRRPTRRRTFAVVRYGDQVEAAAAGQGRGRDAVAEGVVGRRGPGSRLDRGHLGTFVGAGRVSAVGQAHGFSRGRGRSGRARVAPVVQGTGRLRRRT